VYKVVYLDSVEKDLEKLDRPTCKRILDKVETYLAKDPKGLGKALTGEFQGLWRYRVGDFRVIYKIAEKEILIIVARVGHRKNVYD
jgi:mRNA interferase RelE/StbE